MNVPMVEVMRDMAKRFEFGLVKYGKPCLPEDGEDYLQHAYEEALDLCVYLKTCILEREKKNAQNECPVELPKPEPRKVSEGSLRVQRGLAPLSNYGMVSDQAYRLELQKRRGV